MFLRAVILLLFYFDNAYSSIVTVTYDFKITSSLFSNYDTNQTTYNTGIRNATITVSYDSNFDQSLIPNHMLTNYFVNWSTSLDSEIIPEFSPTLQDIQRFGPSNSSIYMSNQGFYSGSYKKYDEISSRQQITSSISSFIPENKSLILESRKNREIIIYTDQNSKTKAEVDLSLDLKSNFTKNMEIGTVFYAGIVSQDYVAYYPMYTGKFSGFYNSWSGTATITNISDSSEQAVVPIQSSYILFISCLLFMFVLNLNIKNTVKKNSANF